MRKYLNFNSYSFGAPEKHELIDTLDSGWITTGPKTKKFEEEFAGYAGAKHAVGVTSGTAALHLALLALGIGKGDEVITTPMTFTATVNAIMYVGARPVLADVEPDTLNIDPEEVAKKITSRTKAIIPVHYAGQPCRMDRIGALARKHGLYVVEDGCHAIETVFRGKKIGSISDVTCFSFHPIKNITTGEGGMATTNSAKLADKLRILRLHGMDKSAWKRYAQAGFRHWDQTCLGYKYNMTDLQASLGICQLRKIDRFWARRKKYAEMYDKLLGKEETLILLPQAEKASKSALNLYPVRVKTERLTVKRDDVINMIQSGRIGVGVHFRAVHLLSFYKKYFRSRRGAFPNAEYASDRLISLPLYPKMTESDVRYVARTVSGILKKVLRRG